MNETTIQSVHSPLPQIYYFILFLNVNDLLVHSMNVHYIYII
jgi:hypothetical protein